jgi:hypothetical protein
VSSVPPVIAGAGVIAATSVATTMTVTATVRCVQRTRAGK